MTPDQVQAIVNMKLTRQDMATILQQQGITFGEEEIWHTPGVGGGGGGLVVVVEFRALLVEAVAVVGLAAAVDLAEVAVRLLTLK